MKDRVKSFKVVWEDNDSHHPVLHGALHLNYLTPSCLRDISLLCPPQSLFLILPFFWPPRPKPDFLTSPSHCLFLVRRFFMPPLCRNCCFCFFLRSFRIWLLVFSSERTVRPPGVFCSPAGLWKLGPCWPRPRPRPRPGKDRWHANKD